jgi:YVTN family beta-propeller protein
MCGWTGTKRRTGRRMLIALVALALVALAPLAAPRVAYADGGAPNLAYVVGGGPHGDDLVVVDIAQRHIIGHVHLGGDPRAVMLSLDGRFVYIAQAATNDVAVVDAHALQVVSKMPTGRSPSAMALDTMLNGYLYVANSASNTVTVFDLGRQRAIATIAVGKHPAGIAVASPASGISESNDGEVYVTNTDDDTVSVISENRQRVIAVIPVPGGPLGVMVPASGGVAYVGTHAGAIVALSLASHRVLGTLLQLKGSATGTMDYDGVTGQIYVPDPADGAVDVLRPVSVGDNGAAPSLPAEPARTLNLGGGPAAVAITFDGAFGFVAQRDAGRVAMLDIGTHKTLTTLDVGGAPRAVVTGSYPPALNRQAANVLGVLGYVFVGLVLLAILGFYLGWFDALFRRLNLGGRRAPRGARGSKR